MHFFAFAVEDSMVAAVAVGKSHLTECQKGVSLIYGLITFITDKQTLLHDRKSHQPESGSSSCLQTINQLKSAASAHINLLLWLNWFIRSFLC